MGWLKTPYILRRKIIRVRRISLKGRKQDYLRHKETARRLVKERLTYFNQFYGFKIGRISIRNQKTRWGSCSKRGNLNFHYKIALIPARLSDYIIVHELCHLGEFNHSKRFWALVAKTIPDYLDIRKGMKKLISAQ